MRSARWAGSTSTHRVDRISGEAKGGKPAKLPKGDGYNVVVQFKQAADVKLQKFRFKLETRTCGGCKRAEYACTCDE